MINRQKLLDAAIQVFAEHGFRGATTRRIAEAAGVNEVTLFRLFKSKSALINEAAQYHAQLRSAESLPEVPRAPRRELAAWAAAQLDFLHASRAVIRKCLAELDEHPQMAACMHHGPVLAHAQLRRYAERLSAAHGLDPRDERVAVACAMMNGVLFADAMGREYMPELYPRPRRRAAEQYARAFLRALGVPEAEVAPEAPARSPVNGRRRRGAAVRN